MRKQIDSVGVVRNSRKVISEEISPDRWLTILMKGIGSEIIIVDTSWEA